LLSIADLSIVSLGWRRPDLTVWGWPGRRSDKPPRGYDHGRFEAYRDGELTRVKRDVVERFGGQGRGAACLPDHIGGDRLICSRPVYVILVSLTDDPGLVIPGLTLPIPPTAANGCTKPSWALAYNVTATSKARLRHTPSRITLEQLADIRRQIAVAVGAAEP
jgi:hypothetical protein